MAAQRENSLNTASLLQLGAIIAVVYVGTQLFNLK
mgnify:CR=1 FL=1|jgi:hypothetical protein